MWCFDFSFFSSSIDCGLATNALLHVILQEKIIPSFARHVVVTLDLTQSLGVVPVSEAIVSRADAIVASTHKWLCGLYGKIKCPTWARICQKVRVCSKLKYDSVKKKRK